MTDIVQESNLASIVRQYRDNAIVAPSRKLLRLLRQDKSRKRLAWILRHHREEEVTNKKEFDLRESFDYLLSFYSILEVACLIRLVPWPLPSDLVNEALSDLFDRDVRRFYEVHYPLHLPAYFRQRLVGLIAIEEKSDRESVGIFMQFLEFVKSAERDNDLDVFLWFLDDGYDPGVRYDISDTLRVIGSRKKLEACLATRPSKRDFLDESVHGFLRFLALCRNLDGLLQRCGKFPLLQSAIWHYFAYWFDLIRDQVGRRIDKAINNFAAWALRSQRSSSFGGPEASPVVVARNSSIGNEYSVREMRLVMQRLLSDEYKVALIEAGLVEPRTSAGHMSYDAAARNKLGIGQIRGFGGEGGTKRLLSDRERQIVRLVDSGYRNREIAERLLISEQTVTNHLRNILGKLGVSRRHELSSVLKKNIGLVDHE